MQNNKKRADVKVAIMQPYFFPYIGYFQLINCVDIFVIFDDVDFINRGWINRNNLLVNGKKSLFTIPLSGASQNKKINESAPVEGDYWKKKLLKKIEFSYKKAPEYDAVYNLIENVLTSEYETISDLIKNSLFQVKKYLDIQTEFTCSIFYKNEQLKGQERIIDICLQENANVYINAIGGKSLYSPDAFAQNSIKLFFIKTGNIEYKQFENEFVPYLSFIDILMFNSVEAIQNMLQNYELVK